jgi:positive regulator of sigma E activity
MPNFSLQPLAGEYSEKTAEVVRMDRDYFWVRVQENGCTGCQNSCTGKALRWFSPDLLLPLRYQPEVPVALGDRVQLIVKEEYFLPLLQQVYGWPLLGFLSVLALPFGHELLRLLVALLVMGLLWRFWPRGQLRKFQQALGYYRLLSAQELAADSH